MTNGTNVGTTRFDTLHAPAAGERDLTDPGKVRSIAGGPPVQAAAEDLSDLRRDLDGLKEAVTSFISQTADKTVDAARGVASQVADQSSIAAERGAELAAEAGEQVKGLAKEIEQIARRNPLSAIAAAAAVGMLIGMMGRRR